MYVASSRIVLVGIMSAVLLLLACRTTDLVSGRLQKPSNSAVASPSSETSPRESAAPTRSDSGFVTAASAVCSGGDDKASVVSGKVLQKGNPVVGQRVQASSGPGGAPIADQPALTDDQGMFNVIFACDGKACDGAFYVWLVDKDLKKVSPFVEFIFDQNCRHGTIDFQTP